MIICGNQRNEGEGSIISLIIILLSLRLAVLHKAELRMTVTGNRRDAGEGSIVSLIIILVFLRLAVLHKAELRMTAGQTQYKPYNKKEAGGSECPGKNTLFAAAAEAAFYSFFDANSV